MTTFTKLYLGFIGIALCIFIANKVSLFDKENIKEGTEDVTPSTKSNNNIHIDALNQKDIVVEHIHTLNKSCPLDVNNGAAKITGVFLNGNKVTYKMKVLNEIDPNIFKEQLDKSSRGLILYLYVIFHGERDPYLMAFIERGLCQVFKMDFPNGEVAELTISTEEFKTVRDYVRNNYHEALQEYVNNQISVYNSYCPQVIEDGIIFESVSKDGNFIVYEIKMNSEEFKYCKSNYDQQKVDFYADLKENSLPILETCKSAKLGVRYRVLNATNSQSIIFEYPYKLLMKDHFIEDLDLSKVNLL